MYAHFTFKARDAIPQETSLKILSDCFLKLNEKLTAVLSKENKVTKELKESCKVLYFPSEWTSEEVLTILAVLNSKEYPNLFIFIIEAKKFAFRGTRSEKVEEVKKNLLKFGASRPLVLQLTSAYENVKRCFYKEENSTQFRSIDQYEESSEQIEIFPNFLCSISDENFDKTEHFEREIINILPQLHNSSLILRFLRILNLSEDFFESLILNVARKGSIKELLVTLDASFDFKGRMLSLEAENYLSNLLYLGQFSKESSSKSEQKRLKEDPPSKNIETEDSSCKTSSMSSKSNLSSSVLHTAVENKNKEVIDYLISYWTHLIQQLPFEHQVTISTAAFETDQLDVLCDLLEISDFPFPENFDDEQVLHERLHKISTERLKFICKIMDENFCKIDEFINKNLNLKICYSTTNKSALKHAVDLKKFKIYFRLKSFGFRATEFGDLKEVLDEKELIKANQFKIQQRRKNVAEALPEDQKSVNLLCNRSSIHNMKIKKEQVVEYRRKIRKWFEDINRIKFGSKFLDVAASCEKMKIIFDFECETVENASLSGPDSLGSMYPIYKWIFVGAKLSGEDRREQEIKGVLAHELCHYVMRLVYENQENPYYKHTPKINEMFKEIVKVVDKWSKKSAECPEDECNRIISSVFTLYARENFHPELIVRVVQILVQFDDDEEKLKYLEGKYKILFTFWELYVIPDLQMFNLKERENVRKMNKIFELFPSIKKEQIELVESKDIKALTDHKSAILISNVPKLLIISIHKHFQEEHGDLFDAQNLFVDPKKLKNQEILSDFTKLVNKNPKLNIFVDCSKEYPQNLMELDAGKEVNLVFIVSNEAQREEIDKSLKYNRERLAKLELNFKWNDLTEKSQKLLLETKVNFQTNQQISLIDLIQKEVNREESAKIVDAQLLSFMVEKSLISINMHLQNEKHFEFVFQPRKFVNKEEKIKQQAKRKWYFDTRGEIMMLPNLGDDGYLQLHPEELLEKVKNQHYVVVSDKAGNGKSWVMKHLAKVLLNQNSTKWVSYVDLKQFIDEFKGQKIEPRFSNIFAEKILKQKYSFEANIFKMLYKLGKVFIIFDGFDEIAPNCAEFVLKLAQSFQYNDGNQLWIATRDYFEIDLKKKLLGNSVYKLDEFTEEEGIDLIVAVWMFTDLKDNINIKTKKEFETYMQASRNFEIYQQKARQIVKKVAMSEFRSVGPPQLYKMIADGFKDDKETALKLRGSEIYSKFVQTLYTRWAYEKGQIRKKANVESQNFEFNFWKFHKFHAIKSLFPKLADIFFPKYDGSEWLEEEVIACGLMSKKNGKFYFLHETFSEYFAADFFEKNLSNLDTANTKLVLKIFKKKNPEYQILKAFVKIFANKEYNIIRMFLNDAIDKSTLEKIEPKIQEFIKLFFNESNLSGCDTYFSRLFTENLETFADFSIEIMKKKDNKKVRIILDKSVQDIARNIKSPEMFLKFEKFLLEVLKIDDLKELITKARVFGQLINNSTLGFESFEEFFTKIKAITDREFIQNEIKLICHDEGARKMICDFFGKSSEYNSTNVTKCLKAFQDYLTCNDVVELIANCKKGDQNIFSLCSGENNTRNLKIVWTEIGKFFEKENQTFKEIVMKNDSNADNILHWTAECNQIDLHVTFWTVLLEIFEIREDLKKFVLKNNKRGNNFPHLLFQGKNNEHIIEYVFKIFEKTFDHNQLTEILKSRNFRNINLILHAAFVGQPIQIHQNLCRILLKSFENRTELIDFLLKEKIDGDNFIHLILKNEDCFDKIKFMLNKSEAVLNKAQLNQFMICRDRFNKNLLQFAALVRQPFQVYQLLWKTIRDSFDLVEEFLEFLKEADKYGKNIFHYAIENSSYDIFDFMMDEVERIEPVHEIRKLLYTLDKNNRTFLQSAAEYRKSIKFHKYLWKIFRKYFEPKEMLKLMKNYDKYGNNIFQTAIVWGTKEIVELTWNEIKSFTSHSERVELLKMKTMNGKNLKEICTINSHNRLEVTQWIEKLLNEHRIQLDLVHYYSLRKKFTRPL